MKNAVRVIAGGVLFLAVFLGGIRVAEHLQHAQTAALEAKLTDSEKRIEQLEADVKTYRDEVPSKTAKATVDAVRQLLEQHGRRSGTIGSPGSN